MSRKTKNEEALRNAIGNLKPQIKEVKKPKPAKNLETASSSTNIKEKSDVKKVMYYSF